jgi:hypothetical protein
MTQAIKPPVLLDAKTCIEDIMSDAARDLSATVEDNSFDYEGPSGTQTHYPGSSVLVEGCVIVEVDVTVEESIPVTGTGSHTTGGCDGEHRGGCREACSEFEWGYKFQLVRAESRKIEGRKGDRLIAVYEIEGRD